MKPVVMLGDINVDNIWPVPALPKPGRDGLVDRVKMEAGGAILNSTIVLDRLGQETLLLGCVGEDLWADYLRQSLVVTDIDLSAMQTSQAEKTGLGFILVTPDGERTMFGYRGANKMLAPEKINPKIFTHAAMLHISGYALLEPPQSGAVARAVQLAKEHDIPISIDTGLEPVLRKKGAFLEILPSLKVCISGVEEVNTLLGAKTPQEAGEKITTAGVALAAIKLGSEGSLLVSKEEMAHCPPFEVNVIDTTGAGDAYSAGIVYGYLQGMSLGATGILANALGALAVGVEGAGFSLPERTALNTFLQNVKWPEGKGIDLTRIELLMHFTS